MNYSEAREYLKNVNKLGSILGLNTIKELLKRLGNPQNELKVVHIAGTNGKGSIMTFVQNILMESGYKVGRYCSPAVFNEREIIRINDEYISEEQSADLLTRIKEKCDSMYSEGLPHPTSFEIETAEALMFFKEQNCDIALIECGMGGETDATNVFEKVLCSVIATISLDHTQFLGSTIEEITKVKSGIIKENCPVVMSKQTGEAESVIKKVCKQNNSKLIIPTEQDFENVEIDGLTTKVTYKASNNKEYIQLNTVPVVAKVSLKKNAVLTRDTISKGNNTTSDDVRRQEYNVVVLPTQIQTGDYVDIRLSLPNGQDYIVVAKKDVEIPEVDGTPSETTMWMNLTENEILSMSSAIVDAAKVQGSKLYATTYTEPGIQNAATPTYTTSKEVLKQIADDPNIVEQAKNELANRYNQSARETIDAAIQSNGEKAETGLTTSVQESITKTQEERKKYLDALESQPSTTSSSSTTTSSSTTK